MVVGGTFGENNLVNVNYLVSLDTYAKYFPEQLDGFVMVKAAPGADLSAMQKNLEAAVKPYADVEVQNQAAYRKSQAGLVNQILGLVTALLAMAILIALFGIANTLGLSILERRAGDRAAPRRRHGSAPGEADDPVGIGHHRRARGADGDRDRRVLRMVAPAGARVPGGQRARVPGGPARVLRRVRRRSPACWRRSGRRGVPRS